MNDQKFRIVITKDHRIIATFYEDSFTFNPNDTIAVCQAQGWGIDIEDVDKHDPALINPWAL